MEWAKQQLDRLLGWYADQNAFIKLCCWLPVVLGLIGLVCLYLLSLRPVGGPNNGTAEAVNTEAQSILTELDEQLKEAATRVKVAQDNQEVLNDHLETTADNTMQLKRKVSKMSHEELKRFMNSEEDADEWGEYRLPLIRK